MIAARVLVLVNVHCCSRLVVVLTQSLVPVPELNLQKNIPVLKLHGLFCVVLDASPSRDEGLHRIVVELMLDTLALMDMDNGPRVFE